MSANDQSRSRLLRWLQNVAVVTVIALLVMKLVEVGIVHDRWGWKSAERELLVKRFNENLMLARTEWLRKGKPATITLRTQQQAYLVMMNRHGWPSATNGCQVLWQILAGGRFNPQMRQAEETCYFSLETRDKEKSYQLIYNAVSGQLK